MQDLTLNLVTLNLGNEISHSSAGPFSGVESCEKCH